MNSHKQTAFTILVLLLLRTFVCGDAEVRCKDREREALLSFKNGLIDDYGILSSWQGEECCQWYGVQCSNATGHVISLVVDGEYVGNYLQGNMSSSLLELHHLKYLDLSSNNFGGGRIPEFIGSMKQLQQLFLQNCAFSGIIPPQLGNLTNLRVLSLSYNYFKSENLDWLSRLSLLSTLSLHHSLDLSDAKLLQQIMNLPSLQVLLLQSSNIGSLKPSSLPFINSSSLSVLDLSFNHLTISALEWLPNISTSLKRISLSDNALQGHIPRVFERLDFLEYLDLSNNTFEGEIPKSIANLRYLQVLYLYRSNLRGNLDGLFGNGSFVSLQELDLTHNQLSGKIPDLGASSALHELYLARNRLTGPIPLSLGKLSNLRILDVSRNLLEGTVSESHLVHLHELKVLDLSFNSLNVSINPDWRAPFQLHTITLAGCKMGLGFPEWIRTHRNISHIDLSSCGIVEVPKWLWSFSPQLEFLLLFDNQISGEIPSLLSSSIQKIDLSYNNISGPIPLFHPNTNSFDLSHNMLSGSISSLCETQYNQLFFLDLSNNNLSGEIPSCWKLPGVFYLNLASNSFSGEIPHSIGSILQNLAVLQLRGNKLSGELPSSLRFCQRLSAIDVGENELSGNIPAWLGQKTKIGHLNFHGNRFSGSISPEICNLSIINVLDFSGNNLSGEIPDCFTNFQKLTETDNRGYFIGFRFLFRYSPSLPHLNYVRDYSQFSAFKWKGDEREYQENLIFLKLIDFSSNRLTGKIPKSFSSMRGLISLNLSRNSLSGNIIPDINKMEKLESLDLSNNQFSGEIPAGLAKLYNLGVLDLSNNSLSGKIPTGTQLQSFNASAYAGNGGLCGPPLALCPSDSLRPPSDTNPRKEMAKEHDKIFSFMQEVCISMAFGFILGFWGLVASFVVKKSWRIAYFNFLDAAGDWFMRTTVLLSK